jgi:lysozyme
MARIINYAGLALIKESEGYRDHAYADTGGVWTIGYGHTKGVKQGDICNPSQAEYWLEQDLMSAESDVARLVKTVLTDNQFAALVSFTFNLGAGALQTLLSHGIDNITKQILRWDHDNGEVKPGLTKRRHKEASLWCM